MNENTPAVVVGIDGRSEDDEQILHWAATEAASRGVPLRVVHVYHEAVQTEPTPYSGAAYVSVGGETTQSPRDDEHPEARRLVDDAVRFAGSSFPSADLVNGVAIEGNDAHDVLIDESRLAQLLVLGSRRRGMVASTFLGSVSASAAAGAHCPVVVVRGSPNEPSAETGSDGESGRKQVVVGVDSSALSEDVLGFAFEYAARHERDLRAVLCWRPSAEYSTAWLRADEGDEQAEAELQLSTALAGWKENYPQVTVEHHVVRQPATRTLVTESADANLLVVGAHGRHAVLDRMLGSVSQWVLHHATCPVAVVHKRE